jgi:hypothetical protein
MSQDDYEALMERLCELYEGIQGTSRAIDYLEDTCKDPRLSSILYQIRRGLEKEQEKLFVIMGRPAHVESPTGEDVPFD